MRGSKTVFLGLVLSSSVFAQDIEINGTISHVATLPQQKSLTGKVESKQIKLLNVKLSNKGMSVLKNRTKTLNAKKINGLMANKELPNKIELGMNNIPVLDQGNNGSCVTFATTAGINAVINKGDYVSQLCSLQLGTYLAQNGYGESGWSGTNARSVLNQIEHFGVVSKDKQRAHGCGGLNEYPHDEHTPSSSISIEEYHQLSEDVNPSTGVQTPLVWSPILDVYQAVLEQTDTSKTLDEVKQAINGNDRVTVGVLLLNYQEEGFMGAVGRHNAKYDTWTLTPELMRDLYLKPNFGGHEMLITGYDDNAITTDDAGRQYKGLLTLRNSWSEKYGDKGEFYMTYDYFKVLVIEAQRIRDLSGLVETQEVNQNIG